MSRQAKTVRHLVVVLGDQLNLDSAAFDQFDKRQDRVWMREVVAEAEHVWNHKARIALFLAAMRHFRDQLRRQSFTVDYRELDADDNQGDFAAELEEAVARLQPQRIILVQPGEWRVQQLLQSVATRLGVALEMREDRHFLCSHQEFSAHAANRKQLRMEYFYREMRRRHGVLLDGDQPCGGTWNFDTENRGSFPKSGPDTIPSPQAFPPDKVTREVLALVTNRFAKHPGSLTYFDWPVTSKQARQALDDFIENRLPLFGTYQDAMWTGETYLYHSCLSAAMNLKLLDPRGVIRAAEVAYRAGDAPLNAVEGFVRQVLGWREYVRGVYWLHMPEYLERNALAARENLPDFFWTAETDMHCLSETIHQTLATGYAHHIQRLMVTGLFTLLLGVDPQQVHQWYLAVYVDAVEWVELPNSLGMSQFADGGVMASKPYVATGKYIQRMSNYCVDCRFRPDQTVGDDACPFTTLYWDFLMRHKEKLTSNPRMKLQLRNVDRMEHEKQRAIRAQADRFRKKLRK